MKARHSNVLNKRILVNVTIGNSSQPKTRFSKDQSGNENKANPATNGRRPARRWSCQGGEWRGGGKHRGVSRRANCRAHPRPGSRRTGEICGGRNPPRGDRAWHGRRRADAKTPAGTIRIALAVDAPAGTTTAAQSYRIRVERQNGHSAITVRGADAAGTMYGGLDVAEAIRTGTLDSLQDSDHTPHIAQRGIKLNIPLDLRTPSYTDPSDAAQANIPEMWSMDFWREFLDDMARHRYNVLTLWSLNPFPSIVKVPEFPHVALDDVWRTTAKLDEKFSGNGDNFVRPEMLAHHEVVKKLTIDEKIQFWRDVMQLAKDRGVDVYLFTWNIFLYGAEGKDGITGDKGAPRTIEYFRASVRETIKTYPLLAGFGITAGESMPAEIGGISKEKWLWKTYGEGIRDAAQGRSPSGNSGSSTAST